MVVLIGYILSAIAFIIRICALGLLEMHLFLEWCMFKLVKLVDKVDPLD